MLRLILAIVGGVVAAFGVVLATDAVVHALSGPAARPESGDAAAMGDYVAGLPVAALSAFVVGSGLAAFVGAGLAARLGGRGAWPGWVVAGLLLASSLANFVLIPHPLWMVIGALALVLAGGWLGARTFASRRTAGSLGSTAAA